MRIINFATDQTLGEIGLLLRREEAESIVEALSDMIKEPDNNQHHISDVGADHLITISLYSDDEENLKHYNERYHRIILEDK